VTDELQPAGEVLDDSRSELILVAEHVEKRRDRTLVADPAERERCRNLRPPIVEQTGERFNGASIADRAERAQRGHPDVRQLAAPFI